MKYDAVVFIHGAGNDSSVWSEVIKLFPKYYKVYAPDLPGHRNQAGICNSIEEYSSWIINYINKKNLNNVVLIGHSMGGAISIISTSLSNRVGAVVIVDSGLKLPVNPKILDGLRASPIQTIKTIAKWSFSPYADDELKNKAIQMMIRNKDILLNDFHACDEYNGSAAIEKIKVPALVVVGELDVMTPIKMAREIADRLSTDVVTIENSGHMVQIENPGKLFEIIEEFLYR